MNGNVGLNKLSGDEFINKGKWRNRLNRNPSSNKLIPQEPTQTKAVAIMQEIRAVSQRKRSMATHLEAQFGVRSKDSAERFDHDESKKRNKTIVIESLPSILGESFKSIHSDSDRLKRPLKSALKFRQRSGSFDFECSSERNSLQDASRFFPDNESTASNRSRSSTISDQIHRASRRGRERADTTASSESVTSTRSFKKAMNSKSSSTIQRCVEQSEKKASEQFQRRHSSSSLDSSKWDSASLGSRLNKKKYNDAKYLSESAVSKFETGLALAREGKYKVARDKLRAALKARILLYKDIHHGSIAPVHEMLGYVELQLKDIEKSRLHFMAAKEICKHQLEILWGRGLLDGEEDEMSKEEEVTEAYILRSLSRIKKYLKKVERPSNNDESFEVDEENPMNSDEFFDGVSASLLKFDESILKRCSEESANFDCIEEVEEDNDDSELRLANEKEVALIQGSVTRQAQMATYSDKRLRITYVSKKQLGQEEYKMRQYESALASFNEARVALLMITSMPKYSSEPSVFSVYSQIKDLINIAELSEHIADCRVRMRPRQRKCSDDDKSGDGSSSDMYGKALKQLMAARKAIENYIDEAGGDAERSGDEADDAEELLRTVTCALARIYTKQGEIYAKLNHHFLALDLYRDSLSVLLETADKSAQEDSLDSGKPAEILNLEDSLLNETNLLIRVGEEERPMNLQLTKAFDLEALATSLKIVSSYHSLGVQALKHSPEDALDHHVSAYCLICSLSRLRTAMTGSPCRNNCNVFESRSSSREMTLMMIADKESPCVPSGNLCNDGEKCFLNMMKRCSSSATTEVLFISHSLFRLRNLRLSESWLKRGVDSVTEVEVFGAKTEIEKLVVMISVLCRASRDEKEDGECLVGDRLALYDGKSSLFPSDDEDSKFHLNRALELVERRLAAADAMIAAGDAIKYGPNSTGVIENHQDLLWAADILIAINLKEHNMTAASEALSHRVSLLTEREGNGTIVQAQELCRLGCLYLINHRYAESIKFFLESLTIFTEQQNKDQFLDTIVLVATAYDAARDYAKAIESYKHALGYEQRAVKRALLMNAVAHCCLKAGNRNDLAVDYVQKSLEVQKKVPRGEPTRIDIKLDTLILYGNIVSAENYLEATFWYDAALNANPNKSPLEPHNLRAWYNKGVALFQNGDIVGAGYAFGSILDAVEENPDRITPGTSIVLNGIGNIHFFNKMYDKAADCYKESLATEHGAERAGILCNIATSYLMIDDLAHSQEYFEKALHESEPSSDTSKIVKAIIMCKLAYVLYMQGLYERAANLYLESASLYERSHPSNPNEGTCDGNFIENCEKSAEMCNVKLETQGLKRLFLWSNPDKNIIVKEPRFESRLIPSSEGGNMSRHSDTLYSPSRKLMRVLGLSQADIPCPDSCTDDQLCDVFLERLLRQTEEARADYALQFYTKSFQHVDDEFQRCKSLLTDDESCS